MVVDFHIHCFSEGAKERILGGNAARLLKLP